MSDILLFLLLLVGSNVLYLACWLSDPGYIVVSLDQTLQTPPNSHTAVVIDGNGRTAATAGSCEAHFVHTDRTEQTAPESSETSKLLNRPSAHAAVSMPQATTQYDDQYCYLCDFTKVCRASVWPATSLTGVYSLPDPIIAVSVIGASPNSTTTARS